MRRVVILPLICSLFWFLPGAHAQTTCELTPLTLPLFDGTPIAEFASPVATPGTASLTEDEARDVLDMYVACTNTGDPTLVWAMFTPRWFSTQFADSEQHYLPAFEYEIANEQYEVAEPLTLESVGTIEPTDDGRVVVTATFSSGTLQWTDNLYLMNVDGQWLIDEVELVSPPGE